MNKNLIKLFLLENRIEKKDVGFYTVEITLPYDEKNKNREASIEIKIVEGLIYITQYDKENFKILYTLKGEEYQNIIDFMFEKQLFNLCSR
jgi:hypothetical protein